MATVNALANKTGTLTVDNGLTVTASDVTVSAGNITLPATNSAGTEGVIKINSVDVVKTYGTLNLFVGPTGNTTLTTASAVQNTIISGIGNGSNLTTGDRNTAVGYNAASHLTEGVSNVLLAAGNNITTGSYNTLLGRSAGMRPVTGSYNTMIGYSAGNTNTTTDQSSNVYLQSPGVAGESHVMRLGATGSGDTQVTNTYIAGLVSKPATSAFLAYLGSTDSNKTGTGSGFIIGSSTALTEVFDQNSDCTTAGVFTAPVTGRYYLKMQVSLSGISTGTAFYTQIVTSNRTLTKTEQRAAEALNFVQEASCLFDMDIGDTAYFVTNVSGESGATVDITGDATLATFICGHLVC